MFAMNLFTVFLFLNFVFGSKLPQPNSTDTKILAMRLVHDSVYVLMVKDAASERNVFRLPAHSELDAGDLGLCGEDASASAAASVGCEAFQDRGLVLVDNSLLRLVVIDSETVPVPSPSSSPLPRLEKYWLLYDNFLNASDVNNGEPVVGSFLTGIPRIPTKYISFSLEGSLTRFVSSQRVDFERIACRVFGRGFDFRTGRGAASFLPFSSSSSSAASSSTPFGDVYLTPNPSTSSIRPSHSAGFAVASSSSSSESAYTVPNAFVRPPVNGAQPSSNGSGSSSPSSTRPVRSQPLRTDIISVLVLLELGGIDYALIQTSPLLGADENAIISKLPHAYHSGDNRSSRAAYALSRTVSPWNEVDLAVCTELTRVNVNSDHIGTISVIVTGPHWNGAVDDGSHRNERWIRLEDLVRVAQNGGSGEVMARDAFLRRPDEVLNIKLDFETYELMKDTEKAFGQASAILRLDRFGLDLAMPGASTVIPEPYSDFSRRLRCVLKSSKLSSSSESAEPDSTSGISEPCSASESAKLSSASESGNNIRPERFFDSDDGGVLGASEPNISVVRNPDPVSPAKPKPSGGSGSGSSVSYNGPESSGSANSNPSKASIPNQSTPHVNPLEKTGANSSTKTTELSVLTFITGLVISVLISFLF